MAGLATVGLDEVPMRRVVDALLRGKSGQAVAFTTLRRGVAMSPILHGA